jgi:hypothetical protein
VSDEKAGKHHLSPRSQVSTENAITSSLGLTFRWPTIILITLIFPIIFIAVAKLRWKALVKEARTRGK